MISQNTSTVPMQSEPQSHTTVRQHVVFIGLLIGVTLLFFSPVLLHAHWGLFDDPSLILQSSRRLMDNPSTISYILAAQMRMGIFYWVTVLWRLFPENPTGFFATNFVLISSALAMVYCICFKLTKNAKVSVLSTATVLASPSLFEVIYTLDKQEVYFPFLFSAVVLLHLLAPKCQPSTLPLLAALSALCATAGYLSKETSIILSLFSVTLLIANLAFGKGNRKDILIRNGIMLAATVVPLLILKFVVFPTISDHYVVVTFELQKLLAKTWQYAKVVPDFFVILAFTTCSGMALAFSKSYSRMNPNWAAFVALMLTSLVSTAALISFDTFAGVLMYIWLPIYFFLAPCLAFALTNLCSVRGGNRINKVFIGAFCALLLSQIPTRFLQAQFQFSFDAITTELAQKLSNIVFKSKQPVICAMPTYTVGETEIPEQIETHVRNILHKRYYETNSEKLEGQRFTMLNFLSPVCENIHHSNDQPNTYRLAEFRGHSLSYTNECPPNYVGWAGFQILNGATPFQQWVKRPYGKDNLLIVPYGEVATDTIQYRGSGIFAHPWKLKLLNYPQLEFEDIGHVERKLTNLIGHRQTLGWRILRVKVAEPITFETSTDGWMNRNGKVFFQYDESKPFIKITTKQPLAPAFTLNQSNSKEEIVFTIQTRDDNSLCLPLQSAGLSGTLRLKPLIGDQRLHIDKAYYVNASPKIKTPFITLSADGWLENNGFIVYDAAQNNKVLLLSSKNPNAAFLVTGSEKSSKVVVDHGIAKIPLTEGKATGNGLFYLTVSSNDPIKSKDDLRDLIIHCDGVTVQ